MAKSGVARIWVCNANRFFHWFPATEETFSSDLWTDTASAAGEQPDITQVPGVIERQIQAVRERYQKMGVPRQYLTSKMIFKLIRGGGGQGFQFQY